jgi:hypothetical protein
MSVLRNLSGLFCFLVLPLCAFAQHTNILIDDVGNPNEPAICLDPKNPMRMMAGANINKIYFSNDGGLTWVKKTQQSTFGVWGDPVLACDTAGSFYHFHLSNPPSGSWIDRIVCQKTTDGGITWNNGSYMGLSGRKNQDKEWVAIDRRNNTIHCTWTQFDKYDSQISTDSTTILYSKSVDAGITWSNVLRISRVAGDCIDSDNTVEGAVPAVGENGEVYVSWAGPLGLVFNRSLDGGNNWLPMEKKIANIGGGWDYTIPGISRCNGLPITLSDTARNSRHRGTIYVNWSDQTNGSTNTDIWLVKSRDGGNTWTSPKRINDDATQSHQFMCWTTLDPTNGNLWTVFYDRRNSTAAAPQATDVYVGVSTDGGETFRNFKVSQASFTPNSNSFFGDYTNIIAYNNVVRPIWTTMDATGKTRIYTAIINVDSLRLGNVSLPKSGLEGVCSVNAYPNPSGELVNFELDFARSAKVSLKICNADGRCVAHVVKKKNFSEGKYTEIFNFKKLKSPSSGTYFYALENEKGQTLAKGTLIYTP